MRKHVTPAHERATIHDPSRGRKLPAGGAEVEWSAYWARLEGRGDVTVAEIAEAPAAPPPVDGDSAAVEGAGEPSAAEAHG